MDHVNMQTNTEDPDTELVSETSLIPQDEMDVEEVKHKGSIYEPKAESTTKELSFEDAEDLPKFDKNEFLEPRKKSPGRPRKYPVVEGQPIKVVKRSVANTVSNSREQTIKKIYKHKDKILEAQIAGAVGFYYETADGKHVYQKKPDLGTGEYLLNQLIGKPKESIEVTSVSLKIDF
jgi:hypothetical protein